MKRYQRKQLLERVKRDGATVGERIPEEITIEAEPVALREFVFELRCRETYPKSERERLQRAKRRLRRGRRNRYQRLESATISHNEGQRLVAEIIGIDRALAALDSLQPTSIEAEASEQALADKRRWVRFLKRALGRETTTR